MLSIRRASAGNAARLTAVAPCACGSSRRHASQSSVKAGLPAGLRAHGPLPLCAADVIKQSLPLAPAKLKCEDDADALPSTPEVLTAMVLRHRTSQKTFGCISSMVVAWVGISLFVLTFAYHVGSPVLDAYGCIDEDDNSDADDDDGAEPSAAAPTSQKE